MSDTGGERHRRPTYVLVPGAMLAPTVWDDVVPRLDGPAIAPDLPSRRPTRRPRLGARPTLRSAARELADAAGERAGDGIVLVGHSLGGAIVWQAAPLVADRLTRIVLVAAEVPAGGRSWLDGQSLPAQLAFRAAWYTRPAGIRVPRFVARRVLGNDLDRTASCRLSDALRPEPPGMYTEPVADGAVPSVPVTYVRLGRDRAVPAARQQATIERVGARDVRDLDTGHVPMLSDPGGLASTIVR